MIRARLFKFKKRGQSSLVNKLRGARIRGDLTLVQGDMKSARPPRTASPHPVSARSLLPTLDDRDRLAAGKSN